MLLYNLRELMTICGFEFLIGGIADKGRGTSGRRHGGTLAVHLFKHQIYYDSRWRRNWPRCIHGLKCHF